MMEYTTSQQIMTSKTSTPDALTILLAFLLSSAVWLICYYRYVLSPNGTPKGFESIHISNLNSIVLCLMATLSLMEYIPEYVPSCWSSSFFLVDLLDCIRRRDVMWGFHGAISLVLNLCTASSDVHRGLRSASKGFFTEGSTVCFYWYYYDELHCVCFMTPHQRFYSAVSKLLENA